MKDEFIYNIKNIFSDEEGSLLRSTKTKNFYIGPYQRSYKWQSDEEFDQVPQLLSDIYDAWNNNSETEYYLQYITVKTDSANRRLEVIDGQQRLTTLSLLFYQLERIINKDNIAKDKIIYSRYDNGNIFDEVCNRINDNDFDEQDMYYMVKASKYINKKLLDWQNDKKLEKVIQYLLDYVKIIVNIESKFVKSEDIFANLNDNHVPLTDAYLIKGLLLTNAVSRVNVYGRTLEYTEIQEKRKNLGRIWDEIQTWVTNQEHSNFFFKYVEIGKNYDPKYSMEYFLELAFLYKFEEERGRIVADYNQNRLTLFNMYNSKIKTTDETIDMIKVIIHIYHKMVTIYEGLQYNLWGFVQFSKSLNNSPLDIYSCLDKSEYELKDYLIKESIKRIPDLQNAAISKDDYKALQYYSNNDKLTNLLLSFSVFLPMKESPDTRFRFYEYDNAKWSLEHISPQNPKGKIIIPNYAKLYVIKDIENRLNDPNIGEDVKHQLEEVKNNVQSCDNDNKIDANSLEFLFDADIKKDSLGNMALLTREDNSANNNNPFMIKKLIIQNRKGKGAFIPNHTYEVFNKILVSPNMENTFSVETFIWNQQDVDAHIEWMKKANNNILDWLHKGANI